MLLLLRLTKNNTAFIKYIADFLIFLKDITLFLTKKRIDK